MSKSLNQSLSHLERFMFILPRDNVAEHVLIPSFSAAHEVKIQAGYFSSNSFSEVAEGMEEFLSKNEAPLKLIISPMLTSNDYEVITSDEYEREKFFSNIFSNDEDVPTKSQLTKFSLECFAWLISRGRLEIKIAVMRDGGQMHSKIWLFRDASDRVAVHGSMNLTGAALRMNRENLKVAVDWRMDAADIDVLEEDFSRMWHDVDDDCVVYQLPEAVRANLLNTYSTSTPPKKPATSETDVSGGVQIAGNELKIPHHLKYDTGDYKHQGDAVDCWESNDRLGILEMATGSGKTITSMIAATRLQNELEGLLIVIAAPYLPLVAQWVEETKIFNASPVNIGEIAPANRPKKIANIGRLLRKKVSKSEVIIVTHDTLKNKEFQRQLDKISVKKLLIADECHNLGVEKFVGNPPKCFDYRLGLSATPVRQYDEVGTQGLIEYFGASCFEFSLEQALQNCLKPYEYHIHLAYFNEEEVEEWQHLSAKIASLSWKTEEGISDEYLDKLYRDRRALIENCAEKLQIFANLIGKRPAEDIRYTLVYCTAKEPEQLRSVNEVLNENGIKFHQLTEQETSKRAVTKEILNEFQSGQLQVLTAKKVLDEGVNVPQIQEAYILASSTVEREWIQRRGRLLRKCEEIGKKKAILHDFVVLPELRYLDNQTKKVIISERKRVFEFAKSSLNFAHPGGGLTVINEMDKLLGVPNEV